MSAPLSVLNDKVQLLRPCLIFMDVRVAQPLGYSEIGSRDNNEDFIYPDPTHVDDDQKWFLVCDGVGGAEKGEVASMLAATTLDTFFRQQPDTVATDAYIQQAVAAVEGQFNHYLLDHEQAAGMATTMTLLYLHKAGATVAHIGDSRVYHIRNGQVIWRTEDHSYVNDLLKAGVLTPDQAKHHPKRNIITRALQGGDKSVQATVQMINDLRAGDYFFLCTDGVLERVSDELLEGTLRDRSVTNELKLNRLRGYSLDNTRDNFTAYLIQIEQATGAVDPAFRVEAPVYERHQDATDIDESVTLIHVPIHDSGNTSSVEAYSAPTSANRPVESEQDVSALPSQQPVNKLPQSGSSQAAGSTQFRAQQPRSTSLSVPMIIALALVGVLIGVGSILAWYTFVDKAELTARPPKPATNTSPAVAISPAPVKPVTNRVSSEPDKAGEEVVLEDLTLPAAETGQSHSSGRASVEPTDEKKEVIKRVDKDVSIARDPNTQLLGLLKSNGKWLGRPHYTQIGAFENGIAPVQTDQGSEKYISRTGQRYDEAKTPSNGKIAVRQGSKWGYLNLNGDLSISLRYDKAGSFDDTGTAEVTLNGKLLRIDKQGHPKPGQSDTKQG